MNIETLATFFGWAFIISSGILLLTTLIVLMFKASVSRLHAKLFDIDSKTLDTLYFSYLGNMKIASIMLFLVPYISLKLM